MDYFRLSARPTLEELTALAQRAGFGTVQDGKMDGLKGAHIGQPGGEYHIYHRDDLWEGSKAQTVLHEMYEITLGADGRNPLTGNACPGRARTP